MSDGEQRASLAQIVDFPSYEASSTNGDYSLLKLSNPITYSAAMRPACLPKDPNNDYTGSMALVSGWGTTSSGGSQPNILMKLDQVPVSKHLHLTESKSSQRPDSHSLL